ncbi:MAG: DUF3871 family protein [Taibaiella sp.]|nr:DUF3871 family protein [Taibaiella sp.]
MEYIIDSTREKGSKRNEGVANEVFIQANTQDVDLIQLKEQCIIPNFSKDNETTISHQEFIEVVQESIAALFPNESIQEPDIKVSHQIKGRIPEAIGKPAKELQEFEKTMYYERMAFTINLPTIKNTINNNDLSLSVGGVRAYNQENLYSKKTMEKFKVFIGFSNSVCTNLCINTDGYKAELRASSPQQLKSEILALFQSYKPQEHLTALHNLGDYDLPESKFVQFIGRARLYQYLPKQLKQQLPVLELNDGQISAVAKAYYEDENFSSFGNSSINLWNLYNLFTGSVKSSYIDTFLDRTVNAHQLASGFKRALEGDATYQWFLG